MKKLLLVCALLGLGAYHGTASAVGTMDDYANTSTISDDYRMGYEAGKAACQADPAACGIAASELPSMWMTRVFGLPKIYGLRMVSYAAIIKIPMIRLKAQPGSPPVCIKDIYMAALPGQGWWGFVPFSFQPPALCPQADMGDFNDLDQLIAPLQ